MIACGRRVRDGYLVCAHIVRKRGDRPSLAALQKLNESRSTVMLVNRQQGYSKLPKYVRKSDAGSHRDIRRSIKSEYINHLHLQKAWPMGVESITVQLNVE